MSGNGKYIVTCGMENQEVRFLTEDNVEKTQRSEWKQKPSASDQCCHIPGSLYIYICVFRFKEIGGKDVKSLLNS